MTRIRNTLNSMSLAAVVLCGIVVVFFVVLSYAWLFTLPPKLTNADYFERVGWLVALLITTFMKGSEE